MSHKKKVHYKNRNRHHLRPKSLGGKNNENLLLIKVVRHIALHNIFGNQDYHEINHIMIRFHDNGMEEAFIKAREKDWKILFKNLTLYQAICLWERVGRAKGIRNVSSSDL